MTEANLIFGKVIVGVDGETFSGRRSWYETALGLICAACGLVSAISSYSEQVGLLIHQSHASRVLCDSP